MGNHNKQVELFDPHPGSLGAAIRLPGPILRKVTELAGKIMDLDEAVKLIQEAADKCVGKEAFYAAKVEAHDSKFDGADGYISVRLRETEEKYPCHSFRAIRYKEKENV